MPDFDHLTETAGRWAASRLTRRSLLGKLGKAAVLVAGGPTLVTLLADDAEARVCGQSGVSALCPTFDCIGGVWGWCWYATGCCAGGRLKKICDCCVGGFPNVHGYCPPGTNVKCIVESCGNDPRLQTVALTRLITDDPNAIAAAARRSRYPNGAHFVVLGDREDQLMSAVALGLAGAAQGAPLLCTRGLLDEGILRAIDRLAGSHALIASPGLGPEVEAQLMSRGITSTRVSSATDAPTLAAEVAAFVKTNFGPTAAACIEPVGVGAVAAPLVAAFAMATRSVVTIGVGTADAGGGTYLVGPEAAARAGEVPGAMLLGAPTVAALSLQLAAVARPAPRGRVVLAPVDSPILMALAAYGAPIVLHQHGTIDGARDWLFSFAAGGAGSPMGECVLAGHRGSLGLPALQEIQSILNGFGIDALIGVGGQGLPVIPQPLSERPIGQARR